MKTILFLTIAIVNFSLASAQNIALNFNEDSLLINGVTTIVENTILNGEMSTIRKSLVKHTKKQYQIKLNEKDNVLIASEIVINQVTDRRGDLIAYLFPKDNDVSLNIAYKLGYDTYLNSERYPDEFNRFKTYLENFVYYYYDEYLPKFIKSKEKKAKQLIKEKNIAQKSNKNASKNVMKFTKSLNQMTQKSSKLDDKIKLAENDSILLQKYSFERMQLITKINESQRQIDFNSQLLRLNEETLKNLSPRIDSFYEEINSAKIALLEIRSKLRTFQK